MTEGEALVMADSRQDHGCHAPQVEGHLYCQQPRSGMSQRSDLERGFTERRIT